MSELLADVVQRHLLTGTGRGAGVPQAMGADWNAGALPDAREQAMNGVDRQVPASCVRKKWSWPRCAAGRQQSM